MIQGGHKRTQTGASHYCEQKEALLKKGRGYEVGEEGLEKGKSQHKWLLERRRNQGVSRLLSRHEGGGGGNSDPSKRLTEEERGSAKFK